MKLFFNFIFDILIEIFHKLILYIEMMIYFYVLLLINVLFEDNNLKE